MTPLNYALQYEMSKKLSKLLYTVDDDIMNVEPLVGDSNYNSVATVNRNGKITRVKYNRKKLDDTLNEICFDKQTDYYGNTTYTCLASVPSPVTADNLLSDWDAETTKNYLKSYELTWNRTLNNIMDTDNKIFNMVGNRKPVGIFDIANCINLLEDGTYVGYNADYDQVYGVAAINYGERLNFKVQFNSKYAHRLLVSNGFISKKIDINISNSVADNRALNINANGYLNNYESIYWGEYGLSGNSYPDISRDSTVQYTITYDNDGVTVTITDNQRTLSVEKYEILTDKVFVGLYFNYTDPIPSPSSRVDIPFSVYKEAIENLPALNTLSFPLPWRVGYGDRVLNSDGNMVITPGVYDENSKNCILNYACGTGINRLKFISEIDKAFNSQYVDEIVIGLTNFGYDNTTQLPYFKFNKRDDDNWDMTSFNNQYSPVIVSSNDLKNFDIVYDSVNNDFILYAQTDPNDTSALDTLPNDPSSNILSFFRNFYNYYGKGYVSDIIVKLKYTGGFDQIPIIKTTRYTPGPSNAKFSFVNALYTTIGKDCTTHYGSTTYPVNFVKTATYGADITDGLGYYTIVAGAFSIAENDRFTVDTNYSPGAVPHKRQVIITTERLSAVDIRAGKYQGLVITYGDAVVELYDYWPYVKYNNQSIENTLPTIFSLKDANDSDAIENSGIDYVAHSILLLGTGSNENKLYRLLVDLSVSEYFIYVIDQDYNYYGSNSAS